MILSWLGVLSSYPALSLRQPKKTHRVSRDTKTEENCRFPQFSVLSSLPTIGEESKEWFEVLLMKEE